MSHPIPSTTIHSMIAPPDAEPIPWTPNRLSINTLAAGTPHDTSSSPLHPQQTPTPKHPAAPPSQADSTRARKDHQTLEDLEEELRELDEEDGPPDEDKLQQAFRHTRKVIPSDAVRPSGRNARVHHFRAREEAKNDAVWHFFDQVGILLEQAEGQDSDNRAAVLESVGRVHSEVSAFHQSVHRSRLAQVVKQRVIAPIDYYRDRVFEYHGKK